MTKTMRFNCSSCVDDFEEEIEEGQQLPMFPMCPACEHLLDKESNDD